MQQLFQIRFPNHILCKKPSVRVNNINRLSITTSAAGNKIPLKMKQKPAVYTPNLSSFSDQLQK